jgi:hypothetical protein
MVNVRVGDYVIASFGDWRGVWRAQYDNGDALVFVTYAPAQQGVDLVKRENEISIAEIITADEAWQMVRHG